MSQSHAGSSVRSVGRKRKKSKGDGSESFFSSYASNQGSMVAETAKHHRQLEQFEAERTRASCENQKWQSKEHELGYKASLYQRFKELKNEMSKKVLLETFPDMKAFYEDQEGQN
jgi:hypothetical protein